MFSKERQEKLRKKLCELNNTQESIQTLSAWTIHYRDFAPQIVQIWLETLRDAEVSHRLPLFNLANDVLQTSRKRASFNYVEAFAPLLPEATTIVRVKEIKPQIERIFNIWEERCIYSSEFINELREALEVPVKKTQKVRVKKIPVQEAEVNYEVDLKAIPPEEYSRILSEYKPKNLVAMIKEVSKLEGEAKSKFVGVKDTELGRSPEKLLKSEKVEQSAYRSLDIQLEERGFYLEEYVAALEKEKESLLQLEQLLHHSQVYHATQFREARMVARAYKNFTARVKGVEKKLNKIKPVLLSPVPSPPADPDIQVNTTPTTSSNGTEAMAEPEPCPPLPEKPVLPPLPPPSTIIENIPLPSALQLHKGSSPAAGNEVPPLPPPPLPPPPIIPPLTTPEAPAIPLLTSPEKLVKPQAPMTAGYPPPSYAGTTAAAMLNSYNYTTAYNYYLAAFSSYPYGPPMPPQEPKKEPSKVEEAPAARPASPQCNNGCGDDMDLDESETEGVIEIFPAPAATEPKAPANDPVSQPADKKAEENEEYNPKNFDLTVGSILGDVRNQSREVPPQDGQLDPAKVVPPEAFKAALQLPGLDDLLKTIATNTGIWPKNEGVPCRSLSPPPFLPSGFNSHPPPTPATSSPTSSASSSQFGLESRSYHSPLLEAPPSASHPPPGPSSLLLPPEMRESVDMDISVSPPTSMYKEQEDSGYQDGSISQYQAEREYEAQLPSDPNSSGYEDIYNEPQDGWNRWPNRPLPHYRKRPLLQPPMDHPHFQQQMRFRPPREAPGFRPQQHYVPRNHRPNHFQPRPYY